MGKQYRITYKIYFNERLNAVSFHGKATPPVYIQLTYRRRTAMFKSYYFDLFSKARYAARLRGKHIAPSVEDVVAMEEKVLEYLVRHSNEDATVETLQQQYYFYSMDLCTSSEESFRVNMFMSLRETGTGAFAKALTTGSEREVLYDVLHDMALVLKADVHQRLLADALAQHQFYLPLYRFVLDTTKPPYRSLSVMEWLDEDVQGAFADYLQRTGEKESDRIIKSVNKWVDMLREKS